MSQPTIQAVISIQDIVALVELADRAAKTGAEKLWFIDFKKRWNQTMQPKQVEELMEESVEEEQPEQEE